ncbi:glycoside hydrolase family 5 protein [Microbacterium sp. H1-D42]|uniref:glycoside hydrolase family 5 protein n=1 Tax=Microbacterium sp. H1-D42 TaxID=2925844 RepID=UPI001F5371CA|nr:glycoside hydrolase family 5 protein [Microbacterium sp. H1-D42]UNK71144.1 glycoside hydrolase family 5 protein [Microbacterium sp. H1-D42]
MRNPSRWILAGALTLVMVGGAVAAAARVAPQATTEFITDASGRDLVPNGFNTASSAKSTPDGMPLFTEEQLDAEHADVGTNFVRFLISWRSVEPEKGEINQAYLDDVEDRVGWYAERGYHVMLDMHQDLWGSAISPDHPGWGNGAPAWATYTDDLPVVPGDMWELVYLEPGTIRAFDHFWNTTGEHPELMEHYASAWKAVAERFADNETVVAYDLMNEPYGGTLQGVAFESGPLTELYQRTTNAIREVDQDSWVCVEPQAFGFNWGVPSALGAIDDPREGDARIAYCPHLYPLPMDLGDGFSGGSKDLIKATVEQWDHNVMRAAEVLGQGNGPVPIILGEFGLDTTRDGAEEYVKLVYDTADASGMGVTYWSRDDGSWGPYETDGTKRNLIDWVHRPYVRAAEGLQSWQSDADKLTFTVSGGGSAEVYLPSNTFQGEPQVDGAEVSSWDADSGILTLAVPADATVTITP